MILTTIVLNKTDCLEDLLHELGEGGIKGATILDSTGMAHALNHNEDDSAFLVGLRHFLNPEREKSKTIFMVTKKELVSKISEIVNKVTGGLDQPDTGIMFCTDITYSEGLEK